MTFLSKLISLFLIEKRFDFKSDENDVDFFLEAEFIYDVIKIVTTTIYFLFFFIVVFNNRDNRHRLVRSPSDIVTF